MWARSCSPPSTCDPSAAPGAGTRYPQARTLGLRKVRGLLRKVRGLLQEVGLRLHSEGRGEPYAVLEQERDGVGSVYWADTSGARILA